MADQKEASGGGGFSDLMEDLPLDLLKSGAQDLLGAVAERAVNYVTDKLEDATGRLTDYAENGGPGLMAAVRGGKALAEGKSPIKAALGAGVTGIKEKLKGAFGGGGGAGGKRKMKIVNILEEFDVGLPLRVAYNQWTQFQDFPTFTRKVESADQESDEKINWKAQIFLSHRTWESTITEQIPDDRIVWRSKGAKGYVDGAVTFHELAPTLTRVLLVLEYHPQGFFEKTGNIWRAQGRRVRSDFKHVKRHMMTHTILEQDDVEGWRGEIRDSEVVKTHEEALQEEKEAENERESETSSGEDVYDEDDADYEAQDAYDEDESEEDDEDEDEYDEDEGADADEYDEDEDQDAEGQDDDEDEEPARPRRRLARSGRGR